MRKIHLFVVRILLFVPVIVVILSLLGRNQAGAAAILGSPLVTDMFHSERWDYVYRFQPGRGEAQQRVLTVFFQDNKLTRVAGNVVAEDDSKPEGPRPAAQVIEIPAPAAAGGELGDVADDRHGTGRARSAACERRRPHVSGRRPGGRKGRAGMREVPSW